MQIRQNITPGSTQVIYETVISSNADLLGPMQLQKELTHNILYLVSLLRSVWSNRYLTPAPSDSSSNSELNSFFSLTLKVNVTSSRLCCLNFLNHHNSASVLQRPSPAVCSGVFPRICCSLWPRKTSLPTSTAGVCLCRYFLLVAPVFCVVWASVCFEQSVFVGSCWCRNWGWRSLKPTISAFNRVQQIPLSKSVQVIASCHTLPQRISVQVGYKLICL